MTFAVYIEQCRNILKEELPELKKISVTDLMCVIDDFMIPSVCIIITVLISKNCSFYDIFTSNREGRNGLLIQEKKLENEEVYEQTVNKLYLLDYYRAVL
jgi:hypothetical protein